MTTPVIHPPVKANPDINWRCWIAAGTVVPPRNSHVPRPSWTGFSFVTGLALVAAGVALAEVLRA